MCSCELGKGTPYKARAGHPSCAFKGSAQWAGHPHVASEGGYAMRAFDLAPLYRSTVGFDRLFSMLDHGLEGAAPGYPPYNIERTGENAYRVSVAVAGFNEPELSVVAKKAPRRKRGAVKCSIRALRRAPSSACSSSPILSRLRARASRTVSCTLTWCARSPRRKSRALSRSMARPTARP